MLKNWRTVMVPSMVALSCLISINDVSAQSNHNGPNSVPSSSTARGSTTGPATIANQPAKIAALNVSGPYTSGNLGIYLIHGTNQAPAQKLMTLQEALEKKAVVVHETGDVNELSVENKGTVAVFLQSGDIVKGGRQDRTLQHDMILRPKSGVVPIKSFCVESGRWSQRGAESGTQFTKSGYMLASKGLKIAAKRKASQGDVWSEVQALQSKYVAKASKRMNSVVAALPNMPISRSGSAAPPRSNATAAGPRTLAAVPRVHAGGSYGTGALGAPPPAAANPIPTASPTSLQLTLETDAVKEMSNTYSKDLSGIVKDKKDVVGYAFAVNGKLNSVDVYSSHDLFNKMWPKLLTSSIQEAAAESENKDAKAAATPSNEEIKRYLKEADSGKESKENIGGRSIVVRKESSKNLFYETRDKISGKDSWIHRNYLTK